MAGFGKFTLVGEFFNQRIVNILRYRSSDWAPLGGNPFDDLGAFVDAVLAKVQTSFLACMSTNYTLLRAEGVGYDDAYEIVTPSPLIRTVNAIGTFSSGATNGAATCANIGLMCGTQTQINGTGISQRNRGYISVGPLDDASVDNYSHVTPGSGFASNLNLFAQLLDDPITVLSPTVTLTPIRIHEKWQRLPAPLPDVLIFRTYSDVLGYTLPRLSSYRRSRRPEA